MATHKNTKKHTKIATFLLFSIGILFSCNTFAFTFTHKIGETYGGGTVFYVYDGGLHGLIAAFFDQKDWIHWYNGKNKLTGTQGSGVNAGAMNTAMIVAAQINDTPGGNFAAKVCADYSVKAADGVTYGDWYLPSKAELNLLDKSHVVYGFLDTGYWSSTEYNSSIVAIQYFYHDHVQDGYPKSAELPVRCVRAF